MSKKMLIDGNYENNLRIVVVDNKNLIKEFKYSLKQEHILSNIYVAEVTEVIPALQAVFIRYAKDKIGFLPLSELHPAYYNNANSNNNSKSINHFQKLAMVNINNNEIGHHILPEEFDEDSCKIDLTNLDTLENKTKQIPIDIEVSENQIDKIKEEIPDNIEEKNYNQNIRIQDVIKRGQLLLVQAQKEERGNKAASFTTYISLIGKYCILMPNTKDQNGISKRIAGAEERKKLKNILNNKLINLTDAKQASVIIRTAGLNSTIYDLKSDYNYLIKLWNEILELANACKAAKLIYVEEEVIGKAIRDLFDHNVTEILVQGKKAYLQARNFMKNILPSEVNKIRKYEKKSLIFQDFGVEEQITNLYQPKVNLQSGGTIIINPTEALTAIDVNSGRSVSEKDIEETALKTNLEAAYEIAKQIRLRNLSGIIEIDFIDMKSYKYRKIIENAFRNYLKLDKARVKLSPINFLGLLSMSRQNLGPSFSESHNSMCNYCSGKGLIRSTEANSLLILRTLENEICDQMISTLNVYAHVDTITYLFNFCNKEIRAIEEKHNAQIRFYHDALATAESFSLEKIINSPNPVVNKSDNKSSVAESENADITTTEKDLSETTQIEKQNNPKDNSKQHNIEKTGQKSKNGRNNRRRQPRQTGEQKDSSVLDKKQVEVASAPIEENKINNNKEQQKKPNHQNNKNLKGNVILKVISSS